MELFWRGYRVCLSTHSPHVLDVVWALRTIRQYRAHPVKMLDVFDAKKTDAMKRVAASVLQKNARATTLIATGRPATSPISIPGLMTPWKPGGVD
jgi:hypothetical protein